MTEVNEIYKCDLCGNVVEIFETGIGELICCGQPMRLFEEKTQDEGQEKHLPVIEKNGNKVIVKVGSIPHPMEDKHFIGLIEILRDNKVIVSKHLYPGENPGAVFDIEDNENITARAYCNVHGLWRSE